MPVDWRKSIAWYKRAAASGNLNALYNLGTSYADGGPGVAADKREAVVWLVRAHEAGHSRAKEELVILAAAGVSEARAALARIDAPQLLS